MAIEQHRDGPGVSAKRAAVMFAMIIGALIGVSIYNLIDGRTTAALAGLAIAAAITPIALRARATG